MKIEFTKGVATGNDFVIIEEGKVDYKKLAKTILRRKYGVGGDGLLVFLTSRYDFHMRIFNPDGSEAKFCGNGARLLLLYAKEKGIQKKLYRFSSPSGIHRGIIKDMPSIEMPEPRIVKKVKEGEIIEVGAPHIIVKTEDIERIEIEKEGRNLSNKYNVNVSFITPGREVRIRTYEKGVDGETESCGSGVAASFFYLMKKNGIRRLRFITVGGIIDAWYDGNIWIKGDAKILFKGKMEVEI